MPASLVNGSRSKLVRAPAWPAPTSKRQRCNIAFSAVMEGLTSRVSGFIKGKVTDIGKTLPESKDVTEDYAAMGIMRFN